MKLCFISNFLNHHQLPLCNSFYRLLGDDFHFIACEQVPRDSIEMGYQKDFDVPYLVDGTNPDNVCRYIKEADVYITGSCPSEYPQFGFNNGKMVFVYSERMFKDGAWRKYSPVGQYNMRTLYSNKKTKNSYLLCASAYTSSDYAAYGVFKRKGLKWGYFPALSDKSFEQIQTAKKPDSIIWAGRFLDWKQPCQVIEAANMLKQDGLSFNITMIGNGPELYKVKQLISDYQLEEQVNLIDYLPFQEVREHMEQHEIALFTSNFMEGWGAVLNEYMSSACAPLANYKAGSTLYLLNNENGIIYDDTVDMLYKKIKHLLENKAELKAIQKRAYDTVTTLWNNEVAAERFVEWAQSALDGNPISYEDGPMSKAIEISNNSAREYIHK